MFRKVGLGCLVLALLAGCGSSGGKPNYSTHPPVPASQTPTVPSPSSATAAASSSSLTLASATPATPGTATPANPTNSPPTEPALAMQHDSDGALAFAAYFIKVLDWSIRNTDPTGLPKLSAASCSTCQRYTDQLKHIKEMNGHVVGGGITLRSLSLFSGTGDVKADQIVTATITQQPDSIVYPTSSSPAPASAAPRTSTSYLFLAWNNAAWNVAEIEGK